MLEISKFDENEVIRLFSLQRMARDAGHLDRALQHAEELFVILTHKEGVRACQLKARAYFERGMVFNSIGDYLQAENDMVGCFINGELAEDIPWSLIGRFRVYLTRYLSGVEFFSAGDALSMLEKIRDEQQKVVHLIAPERQADFNANVYDCQKRICELHFECDSRRFLTEAEKFLDFRELDAAALKPENPSWELIVRNQAEARVEYVHENFEKSIDLLIGHLRVDQNSFRGVYEDGAKMAIQYIAHTTMQEIARDYRDVGRMLLKTDRGELAKKVWEEGIKQQDGRGNRRYIRHMREDLDMLASRT